MPTLKSADLPTPITHGTTSWLPRVSNLAKAMAMCESKLLQAALAAARGNQSLAASRLGVTPRSVYNMIRRHGLIGSGGLALQGQAKEHSE